MNRWLLRRFIYPAYRAVKRDSVLAYLAEMRSVQAMEPDEIRQFQWKKLSRLLDYASKNVPYYRRLFRDLGASAQDFKSLEDFAAIPILRKKDIRFGTDDPLSEIYPRRYLIPGSTSGSTGEKLLFYLDKGSSEGMKANVVRMGEWIGIRVGDRVASLWSVPFDGNRLRRVMDPLRDWFSNSLLLSHFRMDEQTLHSYVRRLKRFKPDVILAHPSALTHFSEFIIRYELEKIQPKAVVVSAESLYEWQREAIENAFGAKVYNHYGCQEFGGIARECSVRKGLHIASERVYVEAVPVEGTSPEDGINELVVTDLDNYGMPFIRYGMGDVGKITCDLCDCGLGLPRLVSAIGRTFDIIRAPNGNFLGGSFWTLLMRKVKGIEQFQVIQEKLREITIAVVATDEFSQDGRQFIIEQIRNACGPEMQVTFDLRDTIEAAPAGKRRFIISKVGLSDKR